MWLLLKRHGRIRRRPLQKNERSSPGQSERKLSHKQKTPLSKHLCGRGGSPVEVQLKALTSYKQNASLLIHGYGRGDIPGAEVQLHKEDSKKAMKPASSSSSSSSEDSDAPFDFSLDAPKTKVVVRKLPPSLSQKAFTESIPSHFDGLFNWISFIPSKPSQRKSTYSRAYIDFKHPEDVSKFFEEFNGHLFVNEKGTKYKALVEYAPHQQVPKPFFEEVTQEGSILEDPEYLEFLDGLAKPIKLLPSAEVQLERKEAEKRSSLAAGAKETVVVTPLMEYVRQMRVSSGQNVFEASRKKSARRRSSSLANSSVLSKHAAGIPSAHAKCAATAVKPSVNLTYVPRHLREDQFVEGSVDVKRKAVFEAREKIVTPEKGLAETAQSDQKLGVSRQSGSFRQIRKDGRLQHTDVGKKSKQSNGFQSYAKQVWVAKPASGP